MQFEFSDRISTLQPSAIREILKATSQPGVIPFAAGNPAPEAFPTEEVREITEKLLTERPIDCLQYGVTEGYTPLRERISTYMKQKHNIGRDFDSPTDYIRRTAGDGSRHQGAVQRGQYRDLRSALLHRLAQLFPLLQREAARHPRAGRRHGCR